MFQFLQLIPKGKALFNGVVGNKAQLRALAQVQPPAQLVANIALGGGQALNGRLGRLHALHGAHIHLGIAKIVGNAHFYYRKHTADPRVF